MTTVIFLTGLPTAHFSQILKAIVTSLPREMVAGLPVREHGGYSKEYLDDCLDTLKAFETGRPECFARGLSIICFVQPSDDYLAISEHFYPFSIVSGVEFGRRFATSPSQASRDKNEAIRLLVAKAKQQVKLASEVSTYLRSRSNRTPILLPLRRFERQELIDAVREAWLFLQTAEHAGERLQAISAEFEKSYPYRRRPGAKSGYFANGRKIEFKAPGRDLHGMPHPGHTGHPEACFLNGRLRLGGAIADGFHYDCTRGENAKYSGAFEACHGQVLERAGRPHLNIYPNDYIR